jgi:hypothetical protein
MSAARALLNLLGADDAQLRRNIERCIKTWSSDVHRYQRQRRPRGQLPDLQTIHCAAYAIKALDDAGVPLTPGSKKKSSALTEFLELFHQWTDELDGHRPRARAKSTIYDFGKAALSEYFKIYKSPPKSTRSVK